MKYAAMGAGKHERIKGDMVQKFNPDSFVIIRIQMAGTFQFIMRVKRINGALST